jgi:hypothetical protein
MKRWPTIKGEPTIGDMLTIKGTPMISAELKM